jgi:hypothetical protein
LYFSGTRKFEKTRKAGRAPLKQIIAALPSDGGNILPSAVFTPRALHSDRGCHFQIGIFENHPAG